MSDMGQVGALEETTDRELRDLFEVHLFGPAALARAVLPHMRAAGRGTIVQMSSFGGRLSHPGFSAYCATKFALEGLSEALAAEVHPLGIRVLIVETWRPPHRLLRRRPAPKRRATRLRRYGRPTRSMITGIDGIQPGDPLRPRQPSLTALEAEQAPLRLALGDDTVVSILGHIADVRTEIHAWEKVSRSTAFDSGSPSTASATRPEATPDERSSELRRHQPPLGHRRPALAQRHDRHWSYFGPALRSLIEIGWRTAAPTPGRTRSHAGIYS